MCNVNSSIGKFLCITKDSEWCYELRGMGAMWTMWVVNSSICKCLCLKDSEWSYELCAMWTVHYVNVGA